MLRQPQALTERDQHLLRTTSMSPLDTILKSKDGKKRHDLSTGGPGSGPRRWSKTPLSDRILPIHNSPDPAIHRAQAGGPGQVRQAGQITGQPGEVRGGAAGDDPPAPVRAAVRDHAAVEHGAHDRGRLLVDG